MQDEVILNGISKRIQERRRELKLSQHSLADACDLSFPYFSRLENQTFDMKVSTLCKIADALDVSCDWLIRGSSKPEEKEKIEREIIDICYRLIEIINNY